MQPRIYLYKVTFEEVPHWYWGIHKEQKFEDGYLGSPTTHKRFWDWYTPTLEIKQTFDYSAEGWEQARQLEDRVILPDLNNPLCLNAAWSGGLSLEVLSENGKRGGLSCFEQGLGCHTPEHRSAGGKIGGKRAAEVHREQGLGLFGLMPEQRRAIGLLGIQKKKELGIPMPEGKPFADEYAAEMGAKGGRKSAEQRREAGTLEQYCSAAGKIGGKATASQRWRCLVTGHICAAGPLTIWQKKRGIDTSLRERLD